MASQEDELAKWFAERDRCLPFLISSCNQEGQASQSLDKVKACMKYLTTFGISEVDSELLQWTMPLMKKSLIKIFEHNLLISGTTDDHFVLTMLEENLKIALGFIQTEKFILEFLIGSSVIRLKEIPNVPVSSAEMIKLTFEHCKNSTDTYKNKFSSELLEMFRVTQETHLLFLQLIESFITIEGHEMQEIDILLEVMDILCVTSEILSDTNFKSMAINWKYYVRIARKFADALKDAIDLNVPIRLLSSEVIKNYKLLENQASPDCASGFIQKTVFVVKVVLKICEVFQEFEKIERELLNFCCIIYSFPLDSYRKEDCQSKILDEFYQNIFVPVKVFVCQQSSWITKVASSTNAPSTEHPFGFLNILNFSLECLSGNEEDFNLDVLVELIFKCTKLCYVDFFYDYDPSRNIFDEIVVRVSGAVFRYPQCYPKIENILLQNVLDENIWCRLLATETWCLILRNASPELRLQTLLSLSEIHEQLDFGIDTCRPEGIFFKNLLRRIFGAVPAHLRRNFIEERPLYKNKNLWKSIGLQSYPDVTRIEFFCKMAVDTADGIGQRSVGLDEFVCMMEDFEMWSTMTLSKYQANPLLNALSKFWEMDYSGANGNFFQYFIDKLCGVTASLISEFNNKQLISVLTNLKTLSSDSSKLSICRILRELSCRDPNGYGQDRHEISALISQLFHPHLLTSTNHIIKQNALEAFDAFANAKGINGGILRNVISASEGLRNELSDYTERNIGNRRFDREYFLSLSNRQFVHKCVEWNEVECGGPAKKLKADEGVGKPQVGAKRLVPKADAQVSASAEQSSDDISEAIATLRGEVKCLTKLLKTERLSAKHVADLRIIANQLLSLQ